MSIELARIVDRGIRESKTINTEKLVIEPGKKVFVVFVDIYVLNHDGNLIDAAAFAAMSALLNTKMANYEIKDGEVQIKPGYDQLPLRKHPITVTIAKIGDKLVVDPSLEEEEVMDARISMAIDDDENICAIQKGGSGYFEPEEIFEAAKIVKAKAEKGNELLQSLIGIDDGAKRLGEVAIGTNQGITKFTKNILFDEKLGGSFHLALGSGYPETGSRNKSMIHWDMICGMKEDSEMILDGETIYRNGKFI
jgi:hypothetical protein